MAQYTQDIGKSLNGLTHSRIQHKNGLNLTQFQSVTAPTNVKNQIMIIPSVSMPIWGGVFNIDIKEKNILLNNITLQFNV